MCLTCDIILHHFKLDRINFDKFDRLNADDIKVFSPKFAYILTREHLVNSGYIVQRMKGRAVLKGFGQG
jgi:hypothetical protein